MKKLLIIGLVLGGAFALTAFVNQKEASLSGAWQTGTDAEKMTTIYAGPYFAKAVYSATEFQYTAGGFWKLENGQLTETYEFHSKDPEMVGKSVSMQAAIKKGKLVIGNDTKVTWSRLDDGTPGKLNGAWLITGRVRNGEVSRSTPGVRKTMKILSGTRFQWIAYNTETKEFLGTGGGNYTTIDGKYVENIDFFSRDNSRVGASLSFDFSIENDDWNHSGLSSKGEPLNEIWTRREKLDNK